MKFWNLFHKTRPEYAEEFARSEAGDSRFDREPDVWYDASREHVFSVQLWDTTWSVTEENIL